VEYVLFFLTLCIVLSMGLGLPNTIVGLRDLVAKVRLAGRRPVPIADARGGRVLLRGRVRRRLLLRSPDGTRLCVAWTSRKGWRARTAAATESFEIIDATGIARIICERPIVLGSDEVGYEGEHTRLVADGDEVLVLGQCGYEIATDGVAGSFREPPRALVVRDRRLIIAPVDGRSSANLVWGIYGLGWGALCMAIVVAMWG
jgi:hypothetical protein